MGTDVVVSTKGDRRAVGSSIPVVVALGVIVILVVLVGGDGIVAYRRRIECWIECARWGSGRKRRRMGIEVGMRMLVMGLDGSGKIIGLVAGVVCEGWSRGVRLRERVRRQRLRVLLQTWVNWVVAHGVGVWVMRASVVGGVNVPSFEVELDDTRLGVIDGGGRLEA